MFLTGTIVNAAAVVVGASVGLIRPQIRERTKSTILQGLSLAVILIGINMGLSDSSDILIVILSMVIGGLLGEWVDIEGGLLKFGQMVERRTHKLSNGQFAEAFVASSLVFCVGAMTVVGAIQSGVKSSNTILFAKSLLDMFSALVFATTLGVGVVFSALVVFCYEGLIATVAYFAGAAIQNDAIIACMNATGGLLIIGIGINLMGLKKISVGNLLPAMFVAAALKWVSLVGVHYGYHWLSLL